MNYTRTIAAILAALTLAAPLASCERTPLESTTDTAADTAQTSPIESDRSSDYFIVPVSTANTTSLYKLNVKTGTFTSICTDPLCTHDSEECPFYGVGSIIAYYENYLYYTHDGIHRYDMITGETYQLISSKDRPDGWNCASLYATGKYLFYYMRESSMSFEEYQAEVEKGKDPERETDFPLVRYDLATGEEKNFGTSLDIFGDDLAGFDKSSMIPMHSCTADTVTWTVGLYSVVTDFDMNVISKTSLTNDNGEQCLEYGGRSYVYRKSKSRAPKGYKALDGMSSCDFYLYNKATGEEKLIVKDMERAPLYLEDRDMFIYMKANEPGEDNTFFKSEKPDDPRAQSGYFQTNNEVWAMNGDGTEAHVICKVDDPYLVGSGLNRFENTVGQSLCKNDCVIIMMSHAYVAEEEEYEEKNGKPELVGTYKTAAVERLYGYAIVNIVTGEYKVVYPDGDPQSCTDRDLSAEIKK